MHDNDQKQRKEEHFYTWAAERECLELYNSIWESTKQLILGMHNILYIAPNNEKSSAQWEEEEDDNIKN